MYTDTHAGEVTIQSTDTCELKGFYGLDRPFLKYCPVWEPVRNKKIPLAPISSTHSTADTPHVYAWDFTNNLLNWGVIHLVIQADYLKEHLKSIITENLRVFLKASVWEFLTCISKHIDRIQEPFRSFHANKSSWKEYFDLSLLFAA